MKISLLFYFLGGFLFVEKHLAFQPTLKPTHFHHITQENSFGTTSLLSGWKKPPDTNPNSIYKIQNKIASYAKWVRYKTIIPTCVLSFSGAWIIRPSLSIILQNSFFWASTLETVLILMSSMMINDLFDMDADRWNHPDRPLVTGAISLEEARIAIFTTSVLIELVNLLFLPSSLRLITRLSLFLVVIYTPILKKIPLVKNAFCGAIIAFAPFFSGLAMTTRSKELIALQPNFDLFAIWIQILFLGSVMNEMLLDIRDYDGDKRARIHTLPTLFGKNVVWVFSVCTAIINTWSSALALAYREKGSPVFLWIPVIFSGWFRYLLEIPKKKFSRTSIIQTTDKTSQIFFFLMLFFCGLAAFR
jgi:geranylgeranylglycerol-phosphate geranylgeranyltransferase